jgi:hypothetical protein
MILLISASWVARIIGMSHRCSARGSFLKMCSVQKNECVESCV